MLRYLVRRTLFMVLVSMIVSLLTFLIFVKQPAGDPVRRAAGKSSTPHQIENARRAFDLDRPLYVQYVRFAKGLVPWPGLFLSEDVSYSHGNFVPVREEIARRLPVTATLAVGAAAIWLVLGIPLGVLAGIKATVCGEQDDDAPRHRRCFHARVLARSTPALRVLVQARLGAAERTRDRAERAGGRLTGSFILPWITVAVGYAAIYARMTRSNVIETMSEDYIRTARSKGLPERTVIAKHGLLGALTPVVTMLGVDLGTLLGGLFITEALFGLPGVGQLAVESITRQDFPMVMGLTVMGALLIAIANLSIDVTYAVLDPRVRYS